MAIIPCFYFGHKLVRNICGLPVYSEQPQPDKSAVREGLSAIWNFIRGTKYMFGLILAILLMISPVIVISFWKPYEMYCLSRLDTTHVVPEWCWSTFPDIYGYIQKLYWKVGFLGFLDRPWYLLATSLATNQLFFYIFYRTLKGHGYLSFITLGALKTHKGEPIGRKTDVFCNLALLPHAIVFIANMLIVLVMANSEINARVASTCPFYFYAFSQLALEVRDEIRNQKAKDMNLPFANRVNTDGIYKHAVVLSALLYNTAVIYLNILLFGNEIGFV